MIPTLLIICYLHRVISFPEIENKYLIYDFRPIIQKIKESQSAGNQRYDVLQDKDNVSLIVQEIVQKGLVPVTYQLDFINFAIFWYFFSTFITQAFALLYYRKYREM